MDKNRDMGFSKLAITQTLTSGERVGKLQEFNLGRKVMSYIHMFRQGSEGQFDQYIGTYGPYSSISKAKTHLKENGWDQATLERAKTQAVIPRLWVDVFRFGDKFVEVKPRPASELPVAT